MPEPAVGHPPYLREGRYEKGTGHHPRRALRAVRARRDGPGDLPDHRGLPEGPVAYLLSALAAVIYLVATVALARGDRTSIRVARIAITIELIGVLTVGLVSYLVPSEFPDKTVWSHFGSGLRLLPADPADPRPALVAVPVSSMNLVWPERRMSHMVQRSAAVERALACSSREAARGRRFFDARPSDVGPSSASRAGSWGPAFSPPAATTPAGVTPPPRPGAPCACRSGTTSTARTGTQQAVEGYAAGLPGRHRQGAVEPRRLRPATSPRRCSPTAARTSSSTATARRST